MNPEGYLPSSKHPATEPYLEPVEPGPQPLNVYVHFIISLPSTSGSIYVQVSQTVFSLQIFQQQFSMHFSSVPYVVHNFFFYINKMKA